jgi:hypothetical protein
VKFWPLALIALCACSPGSDDPADSGTPDSGHSHPARLDACATNATPGTIAAVVDDLDALPMPVDNACFVASLKRPVQLVATVSDFSAQPSPDGGNPRIFLMLPAIVVTVVPAGDGEHLIEMGEWRTALRTLKGEIALPVTAPLLQNAPITRVAQSTHTTTCSLCHTAESPDSIVDGGYVSNAFRPNPGLEVKLAGLQTLHQQCTDAQESSSRCDLFHALFDFGEVQQGAFDPDVALFFQ